MSNVIDLPTVDFLQSGVRYITKEDYIKKMNNIRKSWKKEYNSISADIRACKVGEKIIGKNEISWRESFLYWEQEDFDPSNPFNASNEEIEETRSTMRKFIEHQGRLQSMRASYSREATRMIEDYKEIKSYWKRCAHYSFTIDRMMEETNRRF